MSKEIIGSYILPGRLKMIQVTAEAPVQSQAINYFSYERNQPDAVEKKTNIF